jgi:hypothetical protein
MSKKTTLIGITATALLAASLAACTMDVPGTPEPKSSAAETAAPVEPVALEGDTDGNGSVSELEKSVLAKTRHATMRWPTAPR